MLTRAPLDANVSCIALCRPLAGELVRTARVADDQRAKHEGSRIEHKGQSHDGKPSPHVTPPSSAVARPGLARYCSADPQVASDTRGALCRTSDPTRRSTA